MGELLLELLLGLAEIFFEAFFELVGAALLDLVSRVLAKMFEDTEISSPILASIGYGLLGALTGGLSVLIFPHPLVHPSRIHGVSLLVSPVVAGAVMSLIGSTLRKRDKEVVQIESFGYGFVFAFGMAAVRFCFVK
jgi:uncharacterized membrane protein YeaQ/YmgE (transglycosylase-associated protein family)